MRINSIILFMLYVWGMYTCVNSSLYNTHRIYGNSYVATRTSAPTPIYDSRYQFDRVGTRTSTPSPIYDNRYHFDRIPTPTPSPSPSPIYGGNHRFSMNQCPTRCMFIGQQSKFYNQDCAIMCISNKLVTL